MYRGCGMFIRTGFTLRKTMGLLTLMALMVSFLVIPSGKALAAPAFTTEILTWGMIGLDSNNVNSGPNVYPAGVRVCNVGDMTATNVTSTLVWDSANAYINVLDSPTVTIPSLAAGACSDFYYNIAVTRTSAAHNTTRSYHFSISADGVAPVSTPTPREFYVELLISQSRNAVNSISGPTTVYVGNTYQYVLNSDTAPQGYEQLTTFLNFPNTMFEIVSIATTYTAPAGATNDRVYADACGWNGVPGTANYMSCVGPEKYPGGKAGGNIITTYTVRILGVGTATMTNLIFDKSGSSFHYNADYGQGVNIITVTALSPLETTKADTLLIDADANGAASPGDVLRYQVTVTNLGTTAPIDNITFTDTPDANTTLNVGSVTTTHGSVTSGNVAGQTSVGVSIPSLPANTTATITFDVTINNPVAPGTTQVANQGLVSAPGLPPEPTDDPATGAVNDPTITPIIIPTAISLVNFGVRSVTDGMLVEWETAYESDTWGYHIYRSADGTRESAVRVTPAIVLGQGRGGSGAAYSWKDANAQPGVTYTYWLEEREWDGTIHDVGSVTGTMLHHILLPFTSR